MPRIAVIEDNADNRLLLEVMLCDHFDLTEYETGAEGLEGMRRQRPDLLLLDISLPGMDGLEVLREVRDDLSLRELPVIALTAHAMSGDRERLLEAGFDGYFAKPILDENAFLAEIEAQLRRKVVSTARVPS